MAKQEDSKMKKAGRVTSSGMPHACDSEACHAEEVLELGMPDEELLYDLADLFKVFGDTTRIRILYALMEGDLCVADIAQIVEMSQSAVSHQLRALKSARLVRFRRDGKNVIYSLSDEHVHSILAQGLSHICE